jgi:nicotinamide-nucleotide amidase
MQESRTPRPARVDAPGHEPLADLCRFMKRHGLLLATAESCTAGLIAARLAEVPGAGALLDCACVAYSPEAKQQLLGVSPATLARYNLTSEPVAREMAGGALRHSRANLSIANTGVTDNTDPAVAAGTQCFAWHFVGGEGWPDAVFSETQRFDGDRNEVRERAAAYALARIPAWHAQFLQASGQKR